MSKIKKQIVNRRILKKKNYFTYIYIYIIFKRTFRIFQKSLVKSLTLPIKHYKKFYNFGQVWIGEIENKMPKMLKK